MIDYSFIVIDTETEGWCEYLPSGKPGKRTPEREKTRLIQYNTGKGPVILDMHDEASQEGLQKLIRAAEAGVYFVGQNLAYDLPRLAKLGLNPKNFHDIMVMSQLADAGRGYKHGLDAILERWSTNPYTDYDGQSSDWSGEISEEQLKYAKADVGPEVIATYEALCTALTAQSLWPVMNLEMKVLPILVKMAESGIKCDLEAWEALTAKAKEDLEKAEKALIPQLAEWMEKFTPGSGEPKLSRHAALHKLFSTILHVESKGFARPVIEAVYLPAAEAKGNVEVAEWLRSYLDAAKLAKELSTYGETYRGKADKHGYIRASFSQTFADTGRIQASNPNILNLPRKYQKALWTCEPNEALIKADYSSQEGRILLYLGKEKAAYDALCTGMDLHSQTLSLMSGKDYADLVDKVEGGKDKIKPEFKEKRDLAKKVTFAPAYGAEKYTLASHMGTNEAEASSFLQAYWRRYPNVKRMQQGQLQMASALGFVTDLSSGRKRYLVQRGKARKLSLSGRDKTMVMNYACQASGAACLKESMVLLDEAIRNNPQYGMTLRLVVHDAVVVTCDRAHVEDVSALITTCMTEGAAKAIPGILIPVEVEVSHADA